MRHVHFSKTSLDTFNSMLGQGAKRFGKGVAYDKQSRVYNTANLHIALYPDKRFDKKLQLYIYRVAKTPFVIMYEFDDAEVRVFYILHGRASRKDLKKSSVEW